MLDILRDQGTIDIRRATGNWEQHRPVGLETELPHSMAPIVQFSPAIGNCLIGVLVAHGVKFGDASAFEDAIRTQFLGQVCSQGSRD